MNDWFDAEQHVERAHELYESGRWEDALRELRAALRFNPYQGEWHFNMGLTLDAMGRHAEAIDCYKAALEYQGEDLEVLNSLGVDLSRIDRHAEAAACFERAERLDPEHPASYINRIAAYAALGDHEQAETMFYLALQLGDEPGDPDDPTPQQAEIATQAYLNISQSLLERESYDRAIWCLQQVVRLDPDDELAQARLGDAHAAAGHYDEAHRCYLRQLRRFPGDTDTLLALGELLLEINRPVEAAEKFRRVTEIEPTNGEAYFHLGSLGLRAGHLDSAQAAFEQALQLEPRRTQTRARLAAICLRREDREAASAYLRDELAIVDVADDPEAGETLGQLLLEAEMFEEAGGVFGQLIALQPKKARLHHELGVSMLMADRVEPGIRACRRAVKLDPTYVLAMYNLALADLELGDLRRARYWIRRTLALEPGDKRFRRLATRIRLARWHHRFRRLLRR